LLGVNAYTGSVPVASPSNADIPSSMHVAHRYRFLMPFVGVATFTCGSVALALIENS
jgi:hypothetical protein